MTGGPEWGAWELALWGALGGLLAQLAVWAVRRLARRLAGARADGFESGGTGEWNGGRP